MTCESIKVKGHHVTSWSMTPSWGLFFANNFNKFGQRATAALPTHSSCQAASNDIPAPSPNSKAILTKFVEVIGEKLVSTYIDLNRDHVVNFDLA